ncbi:hypothetical protein EDD17DRAFT_257879 [Pisolithus thermaeus]|nr:hypothetical protein EDD17DRAFT_257879 [Pisolithus thermaeus]
MPSIVNLKFKGNKSFVAFSNLSDSESLTKTWKVCTKVASYLEQGQRLENLSWRLWHLQSLIVDTDNAKSKREFKKLSRNMGDKLDREKGRSIEELEAPDFKRNASTDLIRQRAVERERSREASQNAKPGTIKRMQFTFSVDQPSPAAPNNVLSKPDLKPCLEFKESHTSSARRGRQATRSSNHNSVAGDDSNNDQDSSPPTIASRKRKHPSSAMCELQPTLKFPSLFSNDFGPSALLSASPTLATPMNYGEDVTYSSSTTHHALSIFRPTIELPLDELLDSCNEETPSASSALDVDTTANVMGDGDVVMQDIAGAYVHTSTSTPRADIYFYVQGDSPPISRTGDTPTPNACATSIPSANTSTANSNATTATAINSNAGTGTHLTAHTNVSAGTTHTKPGPSTGTRGRPSLTLRTSSHSTRSSTGPSATATGLSGAGRSASSVGTPGGGSVVGNGANGGANGPVKAECSNCGATHTPLWRRGLNDELNCNACGLYCKLHKRPRPKTMRSNHAERHSNTSTSHTSAHTSALTPTSNAHGRHSSTNARSGDNIGDGAHGTGYTGAHGGSSGGGRGNVSAGTNGSAQCYNCHTTATPLWRKDDEGKTVCNACGLYYKLHGSARPISMKSDVIRKRSRHDASAAAAAAAARRSVTDIHASQVSYVNANHNDNRHRDAGTPGSGSSGEGMTSASASPGASRRASPSVDTLDVSELTGGSGLGGLGGGAGDRSPTLAPDSTTQPAAYEFGEDAVVNVGVHDVHGVGGGGTSGSELMGALGGDNAISRYGSVSNLNMSGLGGMPMSMSSMGLGIDGGGAANGITLGGMHIGGALGHAYAGLFGHHAYPGPYHPDYLSSQFHLDAALPFAGVDEMDKEESPGATSTGDGAGGNDGDGNGRADADEHRISKRRRMSTDSASEPPSSAVSHSSYTESLTSTSTAPTSAISGHSPQQSQASKPHGHGHSQSVSAQGQSLAQSMSTGIPQSQDQAENLSGSHRQGHGHGHSQSLSSPSHSSSLAHAHGHSHSLSHSGISHLRPQSSLAAAHGPSSSSSLASHVHHASPHFPSQAPSHHPLTSHHAFSSHSRRSSMDFPFFTPYGVFRGSVSNTFWHPPMVVAEPDRSPQPFIHPPMLLPDDWPTGGESGASSSNAATGASPSILVSSGARSSSSNAGGGAAAAAGGFMYSAGFHPPMLLPEEENLFATYFHPPMLLPSEEGDVQQEGGDITLSSAASQGENLQQRKDDGSRRDRQE